MQGRNEDKIAPMAVNKETAEKTSAEPVEELTIDQLAQRTGMTVRNIRAHQSRGLLPAPAVKGRIGYYDERHIARLELIQQLQAGGFNLTAIQKLVERAEETGDDIGDLRNLVLTPFSEEASEVISLSELAEQVDFPIDSKLITQAVDMGFAVPLGGDRYEVLSPTLLQSGMRALELGVPVDTLFDVIRKVHTHSRAIAEVFTKMVDNAIVRPEEKKGLPPESFPAVVSAVEGLRPLASEVVMASFRVNMDHAAEEAFGKILQRIAKEDLKTGIQKGEPSNGDKPSSRSRRRKR
jgi:DNA-binding transcriptional MerR regulator